MSLGNKLKELRELMPGGMTQEQLAKASKLSYGAVRHYEQDTRLPGVLALGALANALNVDVKVLSDAAASAMKAETKKAKKPRGRPPKKGPPPG